MDNTSAGVVVVDAVGGSVVVGGGVLVVDGMVDVAASLGWS